MSQTAAEAYAKHWQDVNDKLRTLKIELAVFNTSPYANDLTIAPDWEHVGTMEHVNEMLAAAMAALTTD